MKHWQTASSAFFMVCGFSPSACCKLWRMLSELTKWPASPSDTVTRLELGHRFHRCQFAQAQSHNETGRTLRSGTSMSQRKDIYNSRRDGQNLPQALTML